MCASEPASDLRLRPAAEADREFARPIYIAATKAYAGYLPGWTDDHIAGRFKWRFVVETTRMVELGGVTVGWLGVTEKPEEIILEQIYLQPGRRRQGVGAQVMAMLIEECRAKRKPIRLVVLKTNPARRLYERFGFRVVEEKNVAYVMRRDAVRS